ncbi:MAG: DUF981 family protein [Sulfolobales archaeon]
MAAPSYDWLDSVIWAVGISSILIGAAGLKYRIREGGMLDGSAQELSSFGIVLALTGVFLFISGLAIGIMWPFPMSGGIYNVIFSGSSALGGIMLLAIAYGLFRSLDFRPLSYIAFFFGIYLIVVAYTILSFNLTREPLFSAILYIMLGLTSIISLPAFHLRSSTALRIFGILAIITGLLWIYMGANTTYSHATPPPPTTTRTA